MHFQSRGCCRLFKAKDQLGEDEPHKTDDALLSGDKMKGDDDVPQAYGKEESGKDPQDNKDVHPEWGSTFDGQGLPYRWQGGFASMLGVVDVQPFSRISLLF